MRVLLMALILVSFGCGVVQATEHTMAVTTPVFTRHFPGSHPDLNEQNHGWGLEYILRKDFSVTVGAFNNSLRKETVYAGVAYTPLRILGLHAGAVIGLDLSGGYSSVNPVKPLVGALRLATGSEAPVGFNIDVLPGGGNNGGETVYGAVAVSLKVSF